jgi:hypothetical protein
VARSGRDAARSDRLTLKCEPTTCAGRASKNESAHQIRYARGSIIWGSRAFRGHAGFPRADHAIE